MLSAMECVYQEFKEKYKITNALINKFTGPKEFKISIQRIEKNIDIYCKRRKLLICVKNTVSIIFRVLGT